MNSIKAEASKSIAAPPHLVWTALTEQKKWKRFLMGSDVSTNWHVGMPIRMTGQFKGNRYDDKGEIFACDTDGTLSFPHWSGMSGAADTRENYHVVTFDLSPDGDGILVTLAQTNLTGGVRQSDRAHRADCEKNWQTVLDGLASVVDS